MGKMHKDQPSARRTAPCCPAGKAVVFLFGTSTRKNSVWVVSMGKIHAKPEESTAHPPDNSHFVAELVIFLTIFQMGEFFVQPTKSFTPTPGQKRRF
ncbi:MAG: hypothetical protein J6R77_00790 [Clostridia bacterium]|nr:hypothetical protein [Clostridia bacterium]